MAFDLSIWRRSPTAKTAMLSAVYETLGVRDHPAASMFDAEEFVRAAAAALGGRVMPEETATWVQVGRSSGESVAVSLEAWTGDTTAEVGVSGPFDALEATVAALLPLVVQRDLMLYDPQAEVVYNNRRHYPSSAAR